jgi:hypothetical protein
LADARCDVDNLTLGQEIARGAAIFNSWVKLFGEAARNKG